MDKYEPAIVVFTTSNCTQRAFTWVKKPLNIISQQSITELSVQLCVKHFVTRFYSIQNAVLFRYTVAVNSVVCINTSLILGRPSVSLHSN